MATTGTVPATPGTPPIPVAAVNVPHAGGSPPMRPPMDFSTRGMQANRQYRKWMNTIVTGLAVLATVLVVTPLILILGYLLYKGASSLSLDFFLHLPAPVGEEHGGMANSIVGSGVVLLLASLIGIPVGIAAGVYLAEYGRGSMLGNMVRFTADVLNGVPSIVMGIAVFALLVQGRHFSAYAGGVVLAIMMVPTVTRTTEEMLATVPANRCARRRLGLGIPKWRTVLSVSAADGFAGHYYGLHAGVCACGGRDGSAAVYGAGQPVLSARACLTRQGRRSRCPKKC